MRILHVSTRLILGGSQENTVLSCEGQARRGHDVHLAFGPIYGPEGSLLERVTSFRTDDRRGIGTHVVPSMIRAIDPVKDVLAYKQLKRLIRGLEPDVVHTHSSKAGVLGRAAAWEVNKKLSADRRAAVVHTVHGPPFHPYQGAVKNRVYAAAERFAAKRCHAIVSVCDAMTRQYLEQRIGEPGLYTTVYSGMDTSRFLEPGPGASCEAVRAELGLGENDFVLGTVSRLAELKGHDDILDALADELRNRPNWKLLWVGDGYFRKRLAAKIASLGLENQVVLTGLVPPERVADMMRAMDVLIHASYREGLPRTVPQALLSGVCPIATDVDGTREACIHEQTGILLPSPPLPKPSRHPLYFVHKRKIGTTQTQTRQLHAAIRDAAVHLYEHTDVRAKLAAAGRDLCAQRFSAQHMVDDLETVYQRALETARS